MNITKSSSSPLAWGLFALVLSFLLLPSVASAQGATSMTVVNNIFSTGDLTGWSTISSGGYGSGDGVINNATNQTAQYPNFSSSLPGTASESYFSDGATVST